MLEVKQISPDIVLLLLDLEAFSAQNGHIKGRECETLATQYTLKHYFKDEMPELRYTEHKQPYLEHRQEYISISHSHQKLAIILNRKEPTGIDIELIRDKVKAIQHKFLNEEELMNVKDNTEQLILYWAAKEALYKVYGKKELEFARHIRIHRVSGEIIHGSVQKNDFVKHFKLHHSKLDQYIMVYHLHEIHYSDKTAPGR